MKEAEILAIKPRIQPPLDPDFVPAELWLRAYAERVEADGGRHPLTIELSRPDGTRSIVHTAVLPHEGAAASLNRYHLDRLVKFLLWQRGGSAIRIAGQQTLVAELAERFSLSGPRAFDAKFMGERIFSAPFSVEATDESEIGSDNSGTVSLGRHLDGCRIGFDLGGSDRKAAAVIDGKVVFSEEIEWDPYFKEDVSYHYEGIQDSLRRAAKHLPRVDAIGGSAAGVYVNNRVRVASLFRGIPEEVFEEQVSDIFLRIRDEWGGVPFEVINDGEVTALAGSMAMQRNGVLGIAMGTSTAGGYVNRTGSITTWLNELAFTPVDYRMNSPVDEWAGDCGCGAQYFSQQAVARLIPASGLNVDRQLPLAEQLVEVQEAMRSGMEGAALIYETIGVYLGYALAHYHRFYDFDNLLLLGRVTSGEGGALIKATAQKVIEAEFPELAKLHFHSPDETEKRHGQAVAAASLPAINK